MDMYTSYFEDKNLKLMKHFYLWSILHTISHFEFIPFPLATCSYNVKLTWIDRHLLWPTLGVNFREIK